MTGPSITHDRSRTCSIEKLGVSSTREAMQPFRDEQEAARLREVAEQEEAAARAREELARIDVAEERARPRRPARVPGTLLAILVLFAVIAFSIARFVSSCHHVTPAEYASMTKRTTFKAVAFESHGPVPFDTSACTLDVRGNFGVYQKCDVRLTCANKIVFHNQDFEDCSRNDASTPTRMSSSRFSFDLDTRHARLGGTPWVVLFNLE
jgi:hypothetical protein